MYLILDSRVIWMGIGIIQLLNWRKLISSNQMMAQARLCCMFLKNLETKHQLIGKAIEN